MKLLRAYLDASVLGGRFDTEFEQPSAGLVDAILAGDVAALVSDTLLTETGRAPERVRELVRLLLRAGAEVLPLSAEALGLREAYLAARVLTRTSADDALHVAQATVARADVIVSWNFRHLVNPARVRGFNGVNVAQGYGMVVIMTPFEVIRLLKEMHDEA
jgi:hypothetical protein